MRMTLSMTLRPEISTVTNLADIRLPQRLVFYIIMYLVISDSSRCL